ncbi:uncharacterized membrane protein YoaT (DUF817 family) [Mucilaginibacter gracilis]|uniref:Uncharacterized membrane protein YoaT (DUF817 family) n=1 Tax=Mucilaginibacter gracilis TaxID=423350 RepID=A0A495J5E2_9SPHI|nr:DUF817 domain-containing protein [Mucilaginibacter gracilis]RKR83628.1 uncharacterized membrane protein YoaT (DUF817 family) [Mucilaginibacter gracilis]
MQHEKAPIALQLSKNDTKVSFTSLTRHLAVFGVQQALSCIFPVLVFTPLGLSHFVTHWLPRYDFMLIMCITIQMLMYFTKIETRDEVLVICIFHLLGLMMELFKVHIGSWCYPEDAHTKFLGVPLYSGFMYASVASYMCQEWRRLHLQIANWPNHIAARLVAALIYINFFSNHFVHDVRYLIGMVVIFLFKRSIVLFTIQSKTYRMPVVLSFVLIGFFIWLAENIATHLGAWQYAYQHNAWQIVNYQKLSSWAFLVIVSFIIVAELKMFKQKA